MIQFLLLKNDFFLKSYCMFSFQANIHPCVISMCYDVVFPGKEIHKNFRVFVLFYKFVLSRLQQIMQPFRTSTLVKYVDLFPWTAHSYDISQDQFD